MLTRTHFVFNIFIFLILFPYLDFVNKIIFGIFLVIATYVPDMDSSKSKSGKNILLRPLQWMTKHRGFFHSILFGLILFGIIYSFNISAGFGFFTGFFLHLFLDLFSKSGVAIFWPFKWKVKLFGVKSGGLFEEVFFVLLLLADFLLAFLIVF